MATGAYGTVRPADIQPSDAEIFVHFTPSRSQPGDSVLTRYNGEDLLVSTQNPNGSGLEIFGGLYTLKLPTADFNLRGIYTIIIKPIEIRTTIQACGVLSNLPDNRGVIFNSATIDNKFIDKFINNGLIGYRIEYLDATDPSKKINNFFRIITSNNKVSSVSSNQNNVSTTNTRYTFNDNDTRVFCTVTPSSSPSVRPNAVPFIGQAGQNVIITNTFFNPIMLEIELVDHDIETLAYALLGNQTKSLEDGIYTIYNFESSPQIYKQYNLFEIKDQFNGKPLFEVREERTSIDFTKQFNDIANV
jgi:hypothetical protein